MTVLKLEQLREEMESGSCSDGVFKYKNKEYYFCHNFNDDAYHFGVAHTLDTDRKFSSFDEIMNEVLVGDKVFKDMLPLLQWY